MLCSSQQQECNMLSLSASASTKQHVCDEGCTDDTGCRASRRHPAARWRSAC